MSGMTELGKRYREAFAASEASGDGPLIFPFLIGRLPDARRDARSGPRRAARRSGGIEIGVPFSDPIADGPVHQDAYTVALAAGATLDTALDAVRTARETAPDAPLTLMGYLNPFLAYGASSGSPG